MGKKQRDKYLGLSMTWKVKIEKHVRMGDHGRSF